MNRYFLDENHQASKGAGHIPENTILGSPFAVEQLFRKESFSRWQSEIRNGEMSDQEFFQRMIDVLSPVLEYLACAGTSQNMAVRTWCLLYAVRPDLIHYEGLKSAEERLGVSFVHISHRLQELKDFVPGFSFRRRPRDNVKQSNATTEGRARVAMRTRLARDGAVLDQPESKRQRDLVVLASAVAV